MNPILQELLSVHRGIGLCWLGNLGWLIRAGGRLIAGQPAPLETRAVWGYMTALRPAAYVEFHTHYQAHTAHKRMIPP